MAQTTSSDFLATNTDDADVLTMSALTKIPDLRSFFMQIQANAGAGTYTLEVQGPNGGWVTWGPSSIDATANVLVILSETEVDVYKDARVVFTGTTDTNTLTVNVARRPRQ